MFHNVAPFPFCTNSLTVTVAVQWEKTAWGFVWRKTCFPGRKMEHFPKIIRWINADKK